jgi:uncharacterized protein YodC (DUF2158 family)
MADEIKEGSIVRLASGGPTMTVMKFLNSGDAHCQWFGDKKTLQMGTFPLGSLVAVKTGGGDVIYTA